MEYNNLTEVSKGWLYGLSSLQQLHLAHNAVSRLKADPWEPCQKLAELYGTFLSLSLCPLASYFLNSKARALSNF